MKWPKVEPTNVTEILCWIVIIVMVIHFFCHERTPLLVP